MSKTVNQNQNLTPGESAASTKKISIPEKAGRTMFQALRKTKRLRGKRIDPFGQTVERKLERELIESYRDLITTIDSKLTESNYDDAVAIAGLADQVRG